MRVDFNVPIKDGKVADPTWIVSTLPTIDFLRKNGAKSIILMSHLGRPDGQRNDKFSMKPTVNCLEDLIKTKVNFLNDCVGPEIEKTCIGSGNGDIIMLENVWFHLSEEGKGIVNGEKVKASKDDIKAFWASLTKLGELYVNDAFGTSHWAHSSMVGVNVETWVAGFLLKKELEYFSKVLESPDRPLAVVLGGAKVADKIKLIMNILNISNDVIIGGGMAFTFNKVLNGTKIGKSLFDEEGAKLVPEIM